MIRQGSSRSSSARRTPHLAASLCFTANLGYVGSKFAKLSTALLLGEISVKTLDALFDISRSKYH